MDIQVPSNSDPEFESLLGRQDRVLDISMPSASKAVIRKKITHIDVMEKSPPRCPL
jgi:hypothetical protein